MYILDSLMTLTDWRKYSTSRPFSLRVLQIPAPDVRDTSRSGLSPPANTIIFIDYFDPIATWKKTKLPGGSYTMRELLVPVFRKGECIYNSPSVMEIASYCKQEKETLWDETKRLFYS